FKRFNDSFGHQAGDQILRSLAALMSSRMRSQDVVCRFGGEEFSLLLPDTDTKGALELVEEIRAKAHESPSLTHITFSTGIATWDFEESAEELLARSDAALYEAKDSGRNKVILSNNTTKCGE
ncbi:MAG: GGDEF domain-containing protein, partial [Acidimicrobiales bacterium]|nr:GGDEF domain-containing protein [Acidimicrobiales bacterium]